MTADNDAMLTRMAIRAVLVAFCVLVLSLTSCTVIQYGVGTYAADAKNARDHKEVTACIENGGSWLLIADPAKAGSSAYVCVQTSKE